MPGFAGHARGQNLVMADQEQREQESRESPDTKFQDQRDEERLEREQLADEVSDELEERDD